jgi:hypothetical protein
MPKMPKMPKVPKMPKMPKVKAKMSARVNSSPLLKD